MQTGNCKCMLQFAEEEKNEIKSKLQKIHSILFFNEFVHR